MSIINQNKPHQVNQTPVHLLHALDAAIPQQLLDHWRISVDSLCERARPLVKTAPSCSRDGQNDQIQDTSDSGKGDVPSVGGAA